ncbi:hypothetical protein [Acetobacter senegalensis]
MELSLRDEGLSCFKTLGEVLSEVVEKLSPERVIHGFYVEEINEFDFVHEMEGL